MKKLTIIIYLIIFLVGCNIKTSDILPEYQEKELQISQSEDNLGNKKVDYINIYKRSNDYNETDSWEKYIENLTGITVHIEYDISGYPNNEETVLLDGAFFEDNPNYYMYAVINNKQLYPLNKYYEKYGWKFLIDQVYIDLLTVGEDILSLPCISEPFVNPRFYNDDYLYELNLPVPETIAEFTNFLVEAKKLKSDQYQMVVSTLFTTRQLADIFRAYNVYVSTYNNSMIGYNPKTNSFEDGVFSENFEEAYSFIVYLQNNNILNFERISMLGSPYIYPLATEYSAIYNTGRLYKEDEHIYPVFPFSKGYYLSGINDTQLVELRTYNSYFYFPKSIENIDGYMEEFDAIFTSSSNYLDLKYGMQGIDYDIVNGNFVKLDNHQDNYLSLATVESFEQSLIGFDNGLDYANTLPSSMTFSTNSLLDIIPLSYGPGYDLNSMPPTQFGSIYNVTSVKELFGRRSHFLSEEGLLISEEEAIAEYKVNFKMSNISEYIDLLNEKIGATTKFSYRVDEKSRYN